MANLTLTVVHAPHDVWDSIKLGTTSQLALIADMVMKDATPIRSVDELTKLAIGTVSLQKRTIDRLVICGHGSTSGFRVGADWIDESSIDSFSASWGLIAACLSKNSSVEVSACNAGGAEKLMQTFSEKLGGVSIIGYASLQTGGFPGSGPMTISDSKGSYSPVAPAAGVTPPSPAPPLR